MPAISNKDIQLKVLAQAIYELRLLLSDHLGGNDNKTHCETVSAHLAYVLHNDALAIIEDRAEDFDITQTIAQIRQVDKRFGEQFASRFEKTIEINN